MGGAYGYNGLGAYGYGLGLNGLGYAGLHGLVIPATEKAVDEEAVAEVKTVAAPLAVAPYNLGAYGYGLGAYGYGLGAVHGLAAPATYAGAHYYGKRSADAEADPALLYGAYGYSPYSAHSAYGYGAHSLRYAGYGGYAGYAGYGG